MNAEKTLKALEEKAMDANPCGEKYAPLSCSIDYSLLLDAITVIDEQMKRIEDLEERVAIMSEGQEPVVPKIGHWERKGIGIGVCSECGFGHGNIHTAQYCPKCGSLMLNGGSCLIIKDGEVDEID